MEYCPEYTVFLGKDKKFYGVLSLGVPFIDVLPSKLPIVVDTVLYPYKNQVIYNGLINIHRVPTADLTTKLLDGLYQVAKDSNKIITQL